MKILFRAFLSFIFSFLFLSSVFAVNIPQNLKIDGVNDTTVNLSWEKIQDTYTYILYGKTKSGPYDNTTDFFDGNTGSVSGLESGNTYYFVVRALDDNGEESENSNEVATDILNNNIFTLDSIKANNKRQIELKFSNELDSSDSAEREFKIYKKSDNTDTFEVLSGSLDFIDNSKLILNLDRDLELGEEYELVVISIQDKNGNIIESGLDSIEVFTVNEDDFIVETNTGIIEEVELNSASNTGVEDTVTNTGMESNAPDGINIDTNELNKTTLGAANKVEKLPKTGPEEILLLVLALILGTLIFVFKYKKI